MFLPELCIKRPVLATVMSLAIVLIGIISFQRLPVREYPNIDAPVVSVRTVYSGASAEIMESQVTQPLEDSLAGIEGIRTIKSVSREEVSQITIEFLLERDVDAAANDVRDRVARVRGQLPDETEDPVVAKIEADAQAIMWLAFSSDPSTARWKSPITPTAPSSIACRPCRGWPASSSPASGATPCVCGWIATGWPPTASLRRTWKTR
jgi:multidrug efflux pump